MQTGFLEIRGTKTQFLSGFTAQSLFVPVSVAAARRFACCADRPVETGRLNLNARATDAPRVGGYMADDPNLRGRQDRARIDIHQEHELRHWSQKFGVSHDELRKAVEAVGPMADDVERRLRGQHGRGTK